MSNFPDVDFFPKNMQGLAVAWFRQEDWPRWRALDPLFQPDFGYWQRKSDAAFATYVAAGLQVVKVTITPDEFVEWAQANGKGMGTDARSLFAVFKMMQEV